MRALQVIQEGEREIARPNCAGRIYLCARGLTPETMTAYRIGYDPKIQAVAVPWIDARGRIMAIKYRRIMPDVPKGQRFNALKGGQQLLFGLNRCKANDTCVAVEGEIHALSIAQSAYFDVVSFGGESMVSMLAGLARKYRRLLVWQDDPKVSIRTAERLGHGRIRYTVSPGGLDVNDVLQWHGGAALRRLIERLLTTEGNEG